MRLIIQIDYGTLLMATVHLPPRALTVATYFEGLEVDNLQQTILKHANSTRGSAVLETRGKLQDSKLD